MKLRTSLADKFGIFGIILYVVIVVGGITGYVKNVVQLVRCDFEASYKAEALHIIGIAAPPVGAVMGWIGIEDGKPTLTKEINGE